MKRKSLLAALAALLLLALTGSYWAWSRRSAAGPPAAGPPAAAAETEQERARRVLPGTWRDHYQGQRTMTLKEDGTGTMLVELSGLQATLFAPRLEFDMRWSCDGRVLKKQTLGGEPAGKVALILKAMGDTAEDTVLELTEERLRLLDKDGKTEYHWGRLRQ